MSFPETATPICFDDIRSTDILIRDVENMSAADGIGVDNAAVQSRFYSRLIESLADNIYGKKKGRLSEWNLDSLKIASEKIVALLSNQNQDCRRFIWLRQFPVRTYVMLTKEQTIDKLASDLQAKMRKLNDFDSAKADEQDQQQPQPTQLRYGHKLILTVCTAAQLGLSPYRAASLLDLPPVESGESSPQTSAYIAGGVENTRERHKESPQERNLRLQLRHRYLACVRAKKSIAEFSNVLLGAWGLPEFGKKSKAKKWKSAAAASGACTQGLPPSLVVPTNLTGTWSAAERMAFLEGFEKYPVGQWKKISSSIATR